MGRSPCCDKSKVKRGSWSPQEDAILKNYIQRHGTGGNWIALPHKAGLKRCGKSCRLRWLNYLRPDIKLGGFTQDEEYTICSLYNQIGSRWSFIASHLPGRTDNDVKNYWNTKLKKKLMATKSDVETAVAAAATGAQIAPPAPASYPPESVANVPMKFGPSRLILDGSDCLSGGNDGNLPFCPSQFQQDSTPFRSFCMGVDGSSEVKMDDFSWEILSGIWPQEVGADVDADLFSIFHFDSKPRASQNH